MPVCAALLMVATAVVSLGCAVTLWRRRHLVGAESLAAASVAVALWAGFYAAEIAAADPDAIIIFGDLKYLGILLLPPAWLLFALRFTGQSRRITPRLVLALSVHPVVMLVLLSVPTTHDLVRHAPLTRGASGIPEIAVGPLFWPHAIYVTLVLAVGTAIIVRGLLSVSRRYMAQSLLLVAAALLPWVANLAYNWPGAPWDLDLAPTAYALMQVAYLWGIARFQLFNLVPVARELVLDSLDDTVVVLDAYGRITDLNAAGEQLFGLTRRRAFGRPVSALLPDRPGLLDVQQDGDSRTVVLTRRADRQVRDYDLRVRPVVVDSTRIPGHVVLLRDVTDLQEAHRRLEQLVHYDQLTGLPNRTLFSDRVDRALAQSGRERLSTGVLFCDLDGFKRVNDTHGHEVGDAVLAVAADRIVATLRDNDTAVRVSGDEFIVVLPLLRDEAAAVEVADKVRGALQEPIELSGTKVAVTASIGVAVTPPNPPDADLLRRIADRAMYEAKALGRDRVAVGRATANEGPVVVSAGGRPAVPPRGPRLLDPVSGREPGAGWSVGGRAHPDGPSSHGRGAGRVGG